MRRLGPLVIFAAALLISACYQQPVISPQRPLRCTPGEIEAQCPKGFTCAVIGVCAPNSCQRDDQCPAGLTCSSRGCVALPDGAAADGPPIQIPVLPDGSRSSEVASEPDAGAPAFDLAGPSPDLSLPTLDATPGGAG